MTLEVDASNLGAVQSTKRQDAPKTPYYLYDLKQLRRRIEEFREAFEQTENSLFFATMANDCPTVLKAMAELEVGACVNSLAHLELARSVGFTQVQFTSTGLSPDDMDQLLATTTPVNLDSLGQLRVWGARGGTHAGVRINAASLGAGRPRDRIGVAASDVLNLCDAARDAGVHLIGLHVYVGTNLREHDEALPTIAALFELASRLPKLEYLNIGGGVGVNYARQGPDFDVAAYGSGVTRLWDGLCQKRGRSIHLVIEPGRGLVASCGAFFTHVTDIKTLDGQRFVGVDASIAIFPRPFHHPESPHHIELAEPSRGRSPQLLPSQIVGRSTFSRDILGTASLPMDLKLGDLLVFRDAGAYSQSMRSRFLGQREPEIICI
jgi:diaminopimelate decarboxylase